MTEKKPLNLKAPASITLPSSKNSHIPWRVLIVDDDADVHAVSRLILSKVVFKHRAI
ncbi:MAG: hypothetical protein PHC99_03160 [Methylococcales bacterium]|nr:hypothetical protein [Methylococcales bacterium]